MAIEAASDMEKIFDIRDIQVFECANIKLISISQRKNEKKFIFDLDPKNEKRS
jgi:hypothetical protein